LGWNYWKKKKANQEEDTTSFTETASVNTAPARNDSFPLKRGSKGNRVTQLQNALVKKYGASILPKYGVDGMFGKEVEAALVRAKLPTSINESTYNSFVSASGFAGIIKHGDEIVSIVETEIYKSKGNFKMKVPKHIVLGEKEFTHEGWIYFIPKNSTELFRVKKEQVKSFKEFKNEKS
jgi:peptidoglycan hydrolase-like protein with peptidoglycan-binding domain